MSLNFYLCGLARGFVFIFLCLGLHLYSKDDVNGSIDLKNFYGIMGGFGSDDVKLQHLSLDKLYIFLNKLDLNNLSYEDFDLIYSRIPRDIGLGLSLYSCRKIYEIWKLVVDNKIYKQAPAGNFFVEKYRKFWPVSSQNKQILQGVRKKYLERVKERSDEIYSSLQEDLQQKNLDGVKEALKKYKDFNRVVYRNFQDEKNFVFNQLSEIIVIFCQKIFRLWQNLSRNEDDNFIGLSLDKIRAFLIWQESSLKHQDGKKQIVKLIGDLK